MQPFGYGYDPSQNPLTFTDPHARSQALYNHQGFDPNGNNELGAQYKLFGQALYPDIARRLAFASSLAPQWESATSGIINDLGEQNVPGQISRFGNAAFESAGRAARQSDLSNASAGLGSGFRAGSQAGSYDQAAQQTNQYRAQQESPEARIQRFAGIIQAINQGSQNPFLGQSESLFPNVEARYRQNQSEIGSGSAFKTIAGIAGMANGLPTGGMIGQGSGQGNGGYIPQYGSGTSGPGWDSTNPFDMGYGPHGVPPWMQDGYSYGGPR